MMNSISAKCKRCGRNAPSEQFTLDPVYGMLVCPNCVKERKSGLVKKQLAETKKESAKPAGWDTEDEYLEKAYKQKQARTVSATQRSDGKANYKCPKCKYSFIYDIVRKHPGRCPYCSSEIFRFSY